MKLTVVIRNFEKAS